MKNKENMLNKVTEESELRKFENFLNAVTIGGW